MVYGKGDLRGKVFYGFEPRQGEAYATVWIEIDPRRTAERQVVAESARARLEQPWEMPRDHRWQLVLKSERAIALRTEAEAVEWFVSSLQELRRAGLIDLLPTLGAAAPEEQEDPSTSDG